MQQPSFVHSQISNGVGLITLCRPQALNALSLDMVGCLLKILSDWQNHPEVEAVAVRGSNHNGPFGAFCAGGDIRFFHSAAVQGNPQLEDFFSTEYRLNHLVFTYPKPYIAFMDGVVMGGGMGISQGAQLRIVTENSKLAMPETQIGLFPDVGGGYFLSRCKGASGEYLALTGQMLKGLEAIAAGLADGYCPSQQLTQLWDQLTTETHLSVSQRIQRLWAQVAYTNSNGNGNGNDELPWPADKVDHCFSKPSLREIFAALAASKSQWAATTAELLQQRSPLMLHVTLQQIRTARSLSLADNLRMERNLMHHCFNPHHLNRSPSDSEAVEGIRALVIDKDRNPRWNPKHWDQVTSEMIDPFFDSPWDENNHPLADLN